MLHRRLAFLVGRFDGLVRGLGVWRGWYYQAVLLINVVLLVLLGFCSQGLGFGVWSLVFVYVSICELERAVG